LRDSLRASLVIPVSSEYFVELPPAEVRCTGPVGSVVVCEPERELSPLAECFVTCAMVLWAVTLFCAMSYLAGLL
jgi:hypothetical protein